MDVEGKFLILNHWGKIVGGMSPSRLVYHVYHTSRSRYDAHHNSKGNHMHMSKWCNDIHALLKSIDLEDAWQNNKLEQSEAKQWRSTIKTKIREREEMQWKERMQQKPKLRTYKVMARLRGGANELRIETGRYPIKQRQTS